ncbi:MAG: hypothetical protein IT182_15975 [Acidobacteria bacterium]|nr:hypothetical protein [Acidobacteriota bacterium]
MFLLLTVAAGGLAAYLAVRKAVVVAADERLQSAARQWGRVLAQSTAQRHEEARRAAAHPAIRGGLRPSDPAAMAAAQRQVETVLHSTSQLLSVELWTASKTRIASAIAPSGSDGPGLPVSHVSEPPAAAGLRPVLASGPLVYSELAIEVQASDEERSEPGLLVLRRRMATPAAADLINRLLSDGGAIRVGSRQSGVWTDLQDRVDAPPPATETEIVRYRRADGSEWRGTEIALAGIPWSVWIEVPESVALAPALGFLKGMLPASGAFVVLGGLLAWAVTQAMTRLVATLAQILAASAASEVVLEATPAVASVTGRSMGDAHRSRETHRWTWTWNESGHVAVTLTPLALRAVHH